MAELPERARALAERAAAKRARRAQMEQARKAGLRLRRTDQLLRIARERNAPYIEENQ